MNKIKQKESLFCVKSIIQYKIIGEEKKITKIVMTFLTKGAFAYIL
jgi:hypothetical protein